MSSAICFNLDQSKILLSGNGLKYIDQNQPGQWELYAFCQFSTSQMFTVCHDLVGFYTNFIRSMVT